ncbi:hypothetical protein C8035_v010787 [Colletotrichum spinosum]|uniref:Uncharacterized protein n=1 Tax=Colletotrichum spinosum TaxID=1347390 RepID=A0A4R8Q7M8_9PEZI|nr:hypothetical protein C8035_v010787 [Colletotrichum spinosum]
MASGTPSTPGDSSSASTNNSVCIDLTNETQKPPPSFPSPLWQDVGRFLFPNPLDKCTNNALQNFEDYCGQKAQKQPQPKSTQKVMTASAGTPCDLLALPDKTGDVTPAEPAGQAITEDHDRSPKGPQSVEESHASDPNVCDTKSLPEIPSSAVESKPHTEEQTHQFLVVRVPADRATDEQLQRLQTCAELLFHEAILYRMLYGPEERV